MADSEQLRAFYLGGSTERGTVFDGWENCADRVIVTALAPRPTDADKR